MCKQSGNDSKWFLQNNILKKKCNDTWDPHPLHGKCHKKIPYFLKTSLKEGTFLARGMRTCGEISLSRLWATWKAGLIWTAGLTAIAAVIPDCVLNECWTLYEQSAMLSIRKLIMMVGIFGVQMGWAGISNRRPGWSALLGWPPLQAS